MVLFTKYYTRMDGQQNIKFCNVKAPWRWRRSTETCSDVCYIIWYIYIYIYIYMHMHLLVHIINNKMSCLGEPVNYGSMEIHWLRNYECTVNLIVYEINRKRICSSTAMDLFCTMTKKCIIISQIITLLHVSTLSCHPQGACNQYFAKLHKHFKCSCW